MELHHANHVAGAYDALEHIADRLIAQQLADQQGNISVDVTPLLMLNMWAHAFYLQYKDAWRTRFLSPFCGLSGRCVLRFSEWT